MEGWRDGNIDWVGTGYKVVVRSVRSIMGGEKWLSSLPSHRYV
jgi:hypothetical protein